MSRAKFLIGVTLTCSAFVSISALAADPGPTDTAPAKLSRTSVFEQIDHLNTENALLAARTANAKLRKQLADAEAGRDGTTPAMQPAAMPQPLGSPFPLQPGVSSPRSTVVLLVASAPGVNGGKPTALIQLPDGSRINRSVGGQVPGIGALRTVSVSEVTAFDGKKVVSIPFDGGDTSAGGR